MSLTTPSFVGFLVVTGALLACASTRTAEPLYAEYSLDASRHPESIDCFYGCLRSRREEFRDICLARCEGVVATTTATPCAPGSPALCRSYRVEEPEPQVACDDEGDESDDQLAEVVSDLFAAGVNAALSHDDDRKAHSERRSSSTSKPSLDETPSASKAGFATKSKGSVTPILRSKSKRN